MSASWSCMKHEMFCNGITNTKMTDIFIESVCVCVCSLPPGKPIRQVPPDAHHHSCIPTPELHLQRLHLHPGRHGGRVQTGSVVVCGVWFSCQSFKLSRHFNNFQPSRETGTLGKKTVHFSNVPDSSNGGFNWCGSGTENSKVPCWTLLQEPTETKQLNLLLELCLKLLEPPHWIVRY